MERLRGLGAPTVGAGPYVPDPARQDDTRTDATQADAPGAPSVERGAASGAASGSRPARRTAADQTPQLRRVLRRAHAMSASGRIRMSGVAAFSPSKYGDLHDERADHQRAQRRPPPPTESTGINRAMPPASSSAPMMYIPALPHPILSNDLDRRRVRDQLGQRARDAVEEREQHLRRRRAMRARGHGRCRRGGAGGGARSGRK